MKYTSSFLRRTANGKGWRGVLSYKEDGRWKLKSKSLKSRLKRDAKLELAEWWKEMESEAAIHVVQDDIVEYALAYIARKLSLGAIQPASAKDYSSSMRGWQPYIGGTPLSEITREQIESGLSDMLTRLSANTVLKRYIALNMVLEHAVSVRELKANPMDGIPRPRKVLSPPNSLVGDELERVVDRISALPLQAWVVAVHLCLYAGLRAEETCGLRYSDIDLDAGVGWVRNAIAYGDGGAYVAPPKNGKPRDFPLSSSLREIVRRWIEHQRLAYAEKGIPLERDAWLLALPGSGIVDPRRIGRKWSMLCDIEGFRGQEGRKPSLHDLRHSFATACVRGGMDIKTLQGILGHASAAMTLDVYASADPAAKAGAASLIDSVL